MFPSVEWVFVAQATDASSGKQYALRYKLNSGDPPSTAFNSRSLPEGDSFYPVIPATIVIWGGDHFNGNCNCEMQFVRFFRDYAPTVNREMLNLAFLSLSGNFYFSFTRGHSFTNHSNRSFACALFYERSDSR